MAGIIFILIAISAYNHTEVHDLSARLNQIVSEHNILIQHFSRARQLHHERSFLLQSLSNSRDPFEQDELLIKMNYLFSEIIAIREQVCPVPVIVYPEEKPARAGLKSIHDESGRHQQAMHQHAKNGQADCQAKLGRRGGMTQELKPGLHSWQRRG